MISPRPKQDQNKTLLSWYRVAVRDTAKAFNIPEWDFNTLLIVDAIQRETNNLVSIKQILERLGNGMVYFGRLAEAGYLERIEVSGKKGAACYLYNITLSGEYVVRAFFIRLSRLVNDSKLSRARLNREQKEKLKQFRRPANVKGVKLY